MTTTKTRWRRPWGLNRTCTAYTSNMASEEEGGGVDLGARLLLIAASTIGFKLLISDINNASRQMRGPALG